MDFVPVFSDSSLCHNLHVDVWQNYRKEEELTEDFTANTSLKVGIRGGQAADIAEYSSILGCDAASVDR